METKSSEHKLGPGDIVLYPYLWSWEAGSGLRLADKVRPCLILFRGPSGTPEENSVLICAITSAEVRPPNNAVEVSPAEGRRAQIRRPEDSRVVITECNSDNIETSTHLNYRYLLPGRFSPEFITSLQKAFRDHFAHKKLRMINRKPKLQEVGPPEVREGDYEPG